MSILLVAPTTGYQTRAFDAAAAKLQVELTLATDRCHVLEDPWRDRAVPVRFHDVARSVAAIERRAREHAIHGVLAVGDRAAVVAAHAARALGLPGHPPEATEIARHKLRTRERLRQAGLPVPDFTALGPGAAPADLPLAWPVVVKPAVLSGSRGVIRADTREALDAAIARVRRLLESRDVRAMHDAESGVMVVERFVGGPEYAIEGLMTAGRLQVLAVFDKPDPLDGPFFEETIYVTPSRAPAPRLAALERAVEQAAAAIGLVHGPVHAECRVEPVARRGEPRDTGSGEIVYVIEIAARPIGGLCARALRFTDGDSTIPFEELLLRHAIGQPAAAWPREADASGVMMIPIPHTGVFRDAGGEEAAGAVEGITDVRITAKRDQLLYALPEGATYLGFLFAQAATPERVELALREAHARLSFRIDRPLLQPDLV